MTKKEQSKLYNKFMEVNETKGLDLCQVNIEFYEIFF